MLVVVLLTLASVTLSAVCPGTINKNPIHAAAPVFIQSTTNGKRYLGGQGNDTFHIVHLYGTATEMGTAYGQLFTTELSDQMQYFDEYIEEMITQELPWFPVWLADLVVQYGAGYLLELTYNLTAPFTPARYIEELDAMSAAAGLDKWKLRSVSQFPELIKAACTIVGANGPATKNGILQGGIAHLRGLDFGAHPKIKDLPMVAVYHPSDGSAAVANFGWVGFTGAMTGMSSNPIGVGEKVWIKSDFFNGSITGEAWTFLVRDILRATDMTEVFSIINNANRTCGIHLGVGDGTTNIFRGFEINEKQVLVFNDTTITPYPQHPTLSGIMYWDKGEQPTGSYCLSSLLQQYYGQLDAELLVTTIAAQEQSGDLHCASFDYTNMVAYFANARKTWDATDGPLNAYDRQFTKLDMKALFSEPHPIK